MLQVFSWFPNLLKMYKVLLELCICISIICHCSVIHDSNNPDFQEALMNGFDLNLGTLKQNYFRRINELKRETVKCSLVGSCSNFTKKIEVSLFHIQISNTKWSWLRWNRLVFCSKWFFSFISIIHIQFHKIKAWK